MRRIIPQTLLVSVVLAPFFLIGGAAFTSKSTPIEGRILSDVDFLKDSENHFEIVFFGYVGCSYICPTSLLTLGEVLDELKKEDLELSLGGFFVDVNAETQIARAEEYGLYFSSNIKGANTNQEELDHLRKQFGLTVIDTNREVNEIIHTNHFFVLKRENEEWVVTKVIANQTEKIIIKEAIRKELDQS